MKHTFTLVEVLAVVALIAILGTIGFAGYRYATDYGKESATKSIITRLGAAFESAREREGYLPDTNAWLELQFDPDDATLKIGSGDSPKYVFAKDDDDVRVNGSAPSSNAAKKRMVAFYKDFVKAIQADSLSRHLDGGYLIDGWGNRIYYRYPGIFNKGGFDLLSPGGDGKFGKDDAAAPSSTLTDYRDSSGEMICDDLGNF